MKPFNLEEAKTGKPVVTRDGRKVRIICFDRKGTPTGIVALVKDDAGNENVVVFCNPEGCLITGLSQNTDLFMDTVQKQGYTNLYQDKTRIVDNYVYRTKEEAMENKKPSKGYIGVGTVTWEE